MAVLRIESLADLPEQMRKQVAAKIMEGPEKTLSVAGAAAKASKYHKNGLRTESGADARTVLQI